MPLQQKFPIAYHTGNAAAFKNSNFNIFTAASQHEYSDDDTGIDFYTFKETTEDDSPEQSFVLFIIKNTGTDASLLNLDALQIITDLTGTAQPFSIVDSYGAIGSTGTTGLSTVQTLPSAITNATGYTALNPAPLGYVRINGGTTDVTNTSFGTTGTERYIPFYSTAVITSDDNGIGSTQHDYGTGSQKYPHYAAFLVKCDPAIPLEITEGEVMLQLTQSTGNAININLVMESFNNGNLQFQQGFLTDTEALVDVGVGTWNFTINADFPTITTITSTDGSDDVDDLASSPYVTNTYPLWDFTGTMANNFFTGYMPAGFKYLGNNVIYEGLATKDISTRVPCVRISDSTGTGGGVRFLHKGNELEATQGNSSPHPLGAGFVSPEFFSSQGGGPSFYIVSGSSTPLTFNFASSYPGTNVVSTLGSTEVYYLIWDAGSIRKFHHTQNFVSGTALPYMNALKSNSTKAWNAQVASYPVYHKDYYVNATNNAPTQVEMIQAVTGTYCSMGINQVHHSRLLNKAVALSFNGSTAAWGDDDSNFANDTVGTSVTNARANTGYSYYDNSNTEVIFNRASYYKTELSSSYNNLTLDKISATTQLAPTNLVTANGLNTIKKHLHIKDLFRFPDISLDGTSESLSTVKPVVCWQAFGATETAEWFSGNFNWNSDYATVNTTYDGDTETTTSSPIIIGDLVTLSDNISGHSWQPNGYQVVSTSGVEANGNPITSQAGEGSLVTANTVFANINGFEPLTVAGQPLVQKSIRLATKFIAGSLSNSTAAGFTEDNSSTEAYKEMNWTSRTSGDEIGRYVKFSTFTIKPDRLIKSAGISGRMDTTLANATQGQENISFNLWCYAYPVYSGAHLDNESPQQFIAANFYYTTYGASLDATVSSSWAAGDAVTEAHRTQLSQALNTTSSLSGATLQEQKYASGTSGDVAYFKKYPFNGSGVFKYENYFSTLGEVSAMGSSPYTSAYGILPGPRRQGRFSGSNAISAMVSNNFIFNRTIQLNSAAGTYESFIPIDFGINKANSDYRVQIINTCLDNEMINPGSSTVPTLANPLYQFNIAGNASSENEFMLPIADVSTNPKTAPITTFTIGSMTLATSTTTVNLGTNAETLGVRVGQLVTSSTASALNNGRTVASISGNNIVLNAVPDSNQSGNQTLTFNWLHKDYASWAMVHGSRAPGETTTVKILNRTPNAKSSWQKWDDTLVKPYTFNTTPITWKDTTWDASNHTVGALNFETSGKLNIMPGGTDPSSDTPASTKYNSFIYSWVNDPQNLSNYTNSLRGTPHIHFSINRTKIEANNITSGVFYNRLRVRYILHNKLDNYGVLQKDITGNSFSDDGKGHSFQTGAGTSAHVYEDTYLVKMSFEAVAPTLVLSDVDGDPASNLSTINFGTIHS